MCSSANADFISFTDFEPIGLEGLNAKAAMLERIDNKYVMDGSVLRRALPRFLPDFDVLEIAGQRSFLYDTRYFDSDEHRSYLDHHQGRRQRCKVRIRNYIDAGLCFLEVKLKDKRGATVKKRLACAPRRYEAMPSELRAFVSRCHAALYGEDLPYDLKPALDIAYRRTTLVSKQGGERMTIDGDIVFHGPCGSRRLDGELSIVETKSRNGNGLADLVFRRLHQHPSNRCSKYCTGLAMTGATAKSNNFRRTMSKLGWSAA